MNIPSTYKLIKENYIEELDAKSYLLSHIKSGARVLLMDCNDDNKVFSIGFRTPVSDSTGVPHILEHSVLCGSKKYPVKDPFMFLAKSSLNTFLNAMTFSDKTLYPVASQNEKDLKNLMSIYMDAVFYPNIHSEEQIFMQEGWHYELKSREDELKINGVVYSEMKGVFSDPESVLDRYCENSLYPDTCYGFESGGDPTVIPELTYEDFVAFHKKYYHPSNSYIYLYGNMDFEERLKWLDSEYLSDFEKLDVDSSIARQKPFVKANESEIFYPISAEEEPEGKSWLSIQWSIGDNLDNKLYYALQILEYALIAAEGAPLRNALIDAGIGEDVFGNQTTDIFQPYFKVTVKNTDPEKKAEFLSTIDNALKSIVANGLDERTLLAAINNMEFRVREADFGGYPKGLIYNMQALESWLYDDDEPTMHLSSYDAFKFFRENSKSGYFEKLIEEYFIDNQHKSIVTLIPKAGLASEREESLKSALAKKKLSLSDAEIDALVAQTKLLAEYQDELPSEEALATLPHLELSDISKENRKLSTVEDSVGDIPIAFHKTFTNGISYTNFVYDISDFNKEEILTLALFREIIGLLDTEKHTYGELSDEVNLQMGGLDMAITTHEKIVSGGFKPYFEITCKFFHEKQREALELLYEIESKTLFTDKTRLINLMKQLCSRTELKCQGIAHILAYSRALSYESGQYLYKEYSSGIEYLRYVGEVTKLIVEDDAKSQEEAEKLLKSFENISKKVFDNSRLIISITDDETGFESIKKELLAHYSESAGTFNKATKPSLGVLPERKNEGFKTTSQVNYVSLAGNFKPGENPYTGALQVLRVILSNEYLWNALRVHGGAYGAFCSFARNGDAFFVSYRDPNLKTSLEAYKSIPKFLESFDADTRTMTDYIIGVIGNLDSPLTPSSWGNISFISHISEISEEMRTKTRNEVLECKPEDIRALAPYVKTIIDKNQICTIGGSGSVEKDAELFDKTEKLL